MFLTVGEFMFAYLLSCNIITFLGVGADKLCMWLEPKTSWIDRIFPQILHFWASAVGGILVIALGMVVFRHRIGKRKFMIALLVAAIISVLHTGLLAWAYSQLFVIDSSFKSFFRRYVIEIWYAVGV